MNAKSTPTNSPSAASTPPPGAASSQGSSSNGKDLKSSIAESAGNAVNAARATATQAHESGRDALSSAREGIAGGVSTIARDIRSADLSGVVDRAETFARRNPMLVTGLAVALGFALSRFAKSSEARREAEDLRNGRGRYDPHDAAARRRPPYGASPVSYDPAERPIGERAPNYPPNPGL